jgi:ubiquinone/menaquinone biosynthesis C-methylase UbiE
MPLAVSQSALPLFPCGPDRPQLPAALIPVPDPDSPGVSLASRESLRRRQSRRMEFGRRTGFAGAVLDAGCGTGENALHVASLGLSVLGVDVAETALAIAGEKADDRGIEVEFVAADAFHLECLRRRFETVLDCGLFHTFDGDERPRYVASLASVTEHDGTLYVLCFSDDGPDTGPHPISQEELRAAFNPNNGWAVVAIEPDRIQTRYHDNGAPAWVATIKRI